MDESIAVIGIAGRFPQSSTVEELWEHLRAGEDCVVEVPDNRWERARTFRLETGCRWGGFIDDFDKFDVDFFDTVPWQAAFTDPQERVLLEVVWHLLERAGYTRQRLLETCQSAVGFYVGAMNTDFAHFRSSSWWTEALVSSVHPGSMANRVSHFFDFRGPSVAVDTFCSSAAVALHHACQDLRSGDCKMAIVGGVNLMLHPDRYEVLSLRKHLGTHANSRSFADGDGYLPAEAVGAVLLKPLANAVDDDDTILAVLKATSTNQNGRSGAFGVPNLDAQADVIERCLRKAGVHPSSIGYVEAAASGATLGDPLELAALRRAFEKCGDGKHRCPIGSVKSNIGHAEAASAIAQLAKVLLQLEHGQIVASIKTDPPNPHLNWADTPFHLVRELQEWAPTGSDAEPERRLPRRALLNSFGAGGTNVTVLVEEYVPAHARGAASVAAAAVHSAEAIILSARNVARLRELIERMLEFVSSAANVDIGDIAHTLQIGREAMKSRVAIVASTREELIAGLRACLGSALGAVGPIEAEVPVYFGEVIGSNLFLKAESSGKGVELNPTKHDLPRIALEWTQGASISWRSLPRGRRRVVVLPTYPFERERCWLKVLTHHHPELDEAARPPVARLSGRSLDPTRKTYLAPRNDLEKSLVEIWEQVTGIRHLGVHDRFLDIGGDSMLAGPLINRCEEAFGVRLDVSLLLSREATIEQMAVATVSALASAQIEADGTVEAMIDAVTQDSSVSTRQGVSQ